LADTFVRHIQLGGGMSTVTKNINGQRFVNGIATVRMSDEDFVKVMRYFIRGYQAKEVESPRGKRETDQGRTERPVPPVESDVPESRGAPEGSSDDGGGATDSEAWGEKPKAKRGRPRRSALTLTEKEQAGGDNQAEG